MRRQLGWVIALPAVILGASLLSGCYLPIVFSEDHSYIIFQRSQITYRRHDRPETKCRPDAARQVMVCGDGTTSKLQRVRLPNSDDEVTEFDGRRFCSVFFNATQADGSRKLVCYDQMRFELDAATAAPMK